MTSPPRVAIVGMAWRFPDAPDRESYWNLLLTGKEALGAGRPIWGHGDAKTPHPVRTVGSLDGVDWRALRVSPKEAERLDPQQWLLLELVWEALEDAGIPTTATSPRDIGVIVGAMWNDYQRLLASEQRAYGGYEISGSCCSFLSSRVSYCFNLGGPSVSIDAGCSSSLLAIHEACRWIECEDVEAVVVGAVNLVLWEDASDMLAKAGILSSSGHCRALNAECDGYVRGEGACVLVLKDCARLSDTDHVLAYVRGSNVRHNGRGDYIMAPNHQGQVATIRGAYAKSGCSLDDVDYVELHASGFVLGDATEVNALAEAALSKQRTRPLMVGSTKGNLGSLESASGMASVAKVVLGMSRGVIPPTINISEPNKLVDWNAIGIELVTEPRPWPEGYGQPRLAGISSIAYGGTCAHLVLEAPKQEHRCATAQERTFIVPISAPTHAGLIQYAVELSNWMRIQQPNPCDVAYTLSCRRTHYSHRMCVTGRSLEEFAASIRAGLARRKEAEASCGGKSTIFVHDLTGDASRQAWCEMPSILLARQFQASSGPECTPLDDSPASGLGALLHILVPDWSQEITRQPPQVTNRSDDSIVRICVEPAEMRLLSAAGEVAIKTGDTTEGQAAILASLGWLYELGAPISWECLEYAGGKCISLPPIAWQRTTLEAFWKHPPVPIERGNMDVMRKPEPGLRRTLLDASARKRKHLLREFLLTAVAEIASSVTSEEVDLARPFFEMGMTSVELTQVRARIDAEIGETLPIARLINCRNIEQLASLVFETLSVAIPDMMEHVGV